MFKPATNYSNLSTDMSYSDEMEYPEMDWIHSEASTMCTSDKLKASPKYAPGNIDFGTLTNVINPALAINSPPFEK